MRPTLVGLEWIDRWKRGMEATVTIGLLLAVVGAGMGLFGSELLAVWKSSAADPALASDASLKEVWTFDAPARTVARFESKTKPFNDDVLTAKNWKYTQNPLLDLIASNPFLGFVLAQDAKTNPALNSFLQSDPTLAAVTQSSSLSYIGTFVSTVYTPAVYATVTSVSNAVNTFAQANPTLAPLINSVIAPQLAAVVQTVSTIASTVVQTVSTIQTVINNSLPPNVPKPPVPPPPPPPPPVSPST